ncbi:hypothetical protein HDU98_003709 [Podochytrium sp. JEL0797]|nr:hypothetical protein HDU98_003709 [Podochytrium sp. JEL0797]
MLSFPKVAQFRDRNHAGTHLAALLTKDNPHPTANPIVLALPRGGVPVAFPIAQALNATLDVLIVRKLGIPWAEETAMGAISVGGAVYLNKDLIRQLGISPHDVDRVKQKELAELDRRNVKYREGRPPAEVKGRVVYVVDDGVATGATMQAAIQSLRAMHPARIIAVAPVGAPDSCEEMERVADEVVVPLQPDVFRAVGEWYATFGQTEDEEVLELLEKGKGFGREG